MRAASSLGHSLRNCCIIAFVSGLSFGDSALAAQPKKPDEEPRFDCPAAKEVITAFEYLSDKDTLQMPLPEALLQARRIGVGCEGAAARFVRVAELLRRAGFASHDAIGLGQRFAVATAAQVDAFATIFVEAYLPQGLDLNLHEAVALATKLSADYQGDVQQALEDFKDLVNYCIDKEGLNLPRPRCAHLASQVTHYGEASGLEVFRPFRQGFEFLTTAKKGPGLSSHEALAILHELLAVSPLATGEFISSFRYALAHKNLKLGRNEAIDFAKQVAKLTAWQPAAPPKVVFSSPAVPIATALQEQR